MDGPPSVSLFPSQEQGPVRKPANNSTRVTAAFSWDPRHCDHIRFEEPRQDDNDTMGDNFLFSGQSSNYPHAGNPDGLQVGQALVFSGGMKQVTTLLSSFNHFHMINPRDMGRTRHMVRHPQNEPSHTCSHRNM